MKTRLEEHYHAAVRPALMEKFGYKNTLEVPKIEKIIINKEAPLHISNVAHIDPNSGSATRVGYEVKDGKKVRIARRSGKALD